MFDSLRFTAVKVNILSVLTFALIVLAIISADSIISRVSVRPSAFPAHHNHHHVSLKTDQAANFPQKRILAHPGIELSSTETRSFQRSASSRRFDSRVGQFFGSGQCRVQFFMTWIAPVVSSFGEREFVGLESLFKSNPRSCLIILSSAMDSEEGRKILEPLIDRGFRVQSVAPDLWCLFNNTPAEDWWADIVNGYKDPGEIPLAQNLSNLIRLAVLYKYGGVYLDTDFIILKEFSGLRNSIGAQSVDIKGNWSRLNNAVLVFDKKHPLVYKFIEEFAVTYDGDKWGHNGPYLVSRVVDRVAKTGGEFNFTVLPPVAFYPVDWTRIPGFFIRPNDSLHEEWVRRKIRHLRRSSYGVHLWNRESRSLKIEKGSIVESLVSSQCVICSWNVSSS